MKTKALSTLVMFPCVILFGAVLGGVYVAHFMARSPEGWDQLANFLGGLMLGAMAGLVLSLVMAFWLSPRSMVKAAVFSAVGSLLILGYLWWSRDVAPQAPPTTPKAPTEAASVPSPREFVLSSPTGA